MEIDTWRNSIAQKIKELENMGQKELETKLANLHQYLGVSTLDEALTIIKKARNNKVQGAPQKAAPIKELGQIPAIGGRKTWGRGRKIPMEIKNQVIDLLKTNQYTADEVAQKTKVSAAAVNKIKKGAGLVNERAVIG